MPYIEESTRDRFDDLVDELLLWMSGPGNFNYIITKLALGYAGDNASYSDFNEIVGVLECAKQEFYRRAVSPYEDEKIIENGDVY